MAAKTFFKIVITGPESSGKTELSESLAQAFQTRPVPEFARSYVAHLGRAYERSDLIRIARGQKNWEAWYAAQPDSGRPGRFLVCDTDWTVLQIWEQYRFQPAGGYVWPLGYGQAQNADLYLLAPPIFPGCPTPCASTRKNGMSFLPCTGNYWRTGRPALWFLPAIARTGWRRHLRRSGNYCELCGKKLIGVPEFRLRLHPSNLRG